MTRWSSLVGKWEHRFARLLFSCPYQSSGESRSSFHWVPVPAYLGGYISRRYRPSLRSLLSVLRESLPKNKNFLEPDHNFTVKANDDGFTRLLEAAASCTEAETPFAEF